MDKNCLPSLWVWLLLQQAAMGGDAKEKALMDVFQMLDRNGSGSVELKVRAV